MFLFALVSPALASSGPFSSIIIFVSFHFTLSACLPISIIHCRSPLSDTVGHSIPKEGVLGSDFLLTFPGLQEALVIMGGTHQKLSWVLAVPRVHQVACLPVGIQQKYPVPCFAWHMIWYFKAAKEPGAAVPLMSSRSFYWISITRKPGKKQKPDHYLEILTLVIPPGLCW